MGPFQMMLMSISWTYGSWSFDSRTYPIGSMYAIYGNMDPINIPPNVSIYTIHGSYGYGSFLAHFGCLISSASRWGDVLKAAVSSSGEALQYASDELHLGSPPRFGQLFGMAWDFPNPPYIYCYCYVYFMCIYIYIILHTYIYIFTYLYIYVINMCVCVDSWIRHGSSFGGLRNQQGTTTEVFIPLMFHPKRCEEWTASPRWYWSFVVGFPSPRSHHFRLVIVFCCFAPTVAAWKQTSKKITRSICRNQFPMLCVDISMWFLCISIQLFLKKRHKYKD